MEHVPVTFQGHVGICYGHAAAQMLDAWRFSHGSGDSSSLSSPFEIAVGVTDATTPKVDFDDGAYNVCPSIHYGMKMGTCDSAWVEDLYSAQGVQRADFADLVKKLQTDVKQAHEQSAELSLATQAEKDLVKLIAPSESEAVQALPASDALLKDVQRASYTEAMYEFLKPYCAKKARNSIPGGIKCLDSRGLSGKDIFQRVHQLLLQKNPQPVAIKMCRNLFEQGHTYVGVSGNGFTADCQIHWPLVIGQKMIGGKCHFLVRNSFGTGDTGYSPDWMPREHGNLWIDEDALINNTLQMSYLSQ